MLVFYIFIFLFGLSVGSFLNCVIWRLEKEESLMGRSYCPNCKHKLIWLDLIPVSSYFYLKGKCRYCNKKISIQYPLVEIITGLIFLLIFRFYPAYNLQEFIALCFMLYVSCSMIVIFVYDLRHYMIPDKVLLPAIAITFIYQLVINSKPHILNYLLSALITAGFFLAIYLMSKGEWMGFGDVKLAILLGLVLGFPNILLGIFLGFLFGAIIGGGLIFLNKKELKSQMPFAPFLIAGTGVAMFFGDNIINWYTLLIFNF